MQESSTLYVGMDVHKESIAVAYVAKKHDAEVIYLGSIGTRHGDLDHLIRNLQSKATQTNCGPSGPTPAQSAAHSVA